MGYLRKLQRHSVMAKDILSRLYKTSKMCIRDRVSSYEVHDIVTLMREQDPHVIINVLPTETFFGGFYQKPIE